MLLIVQSIAHAHPGNEHYWCIFPNTQEAMAFWGEKYEDFDGPIGACLSVHREW